MPTRHFFTCEYSSQAYPPTPKTTHPTPDDLRCSLCSAPSVLVSQIYAPLDDSPYHRTLYLFACLSPMCWNKTER